MATIHKKVWPEYFEKIISGKKKLELRLADFEINEGDAFILEKWDNKEEYTGRKVEVVATYILLHPQNQRPNFLAARGS